jgi:hypothetical protein
LPPCRISGVVLGEYAEEHVEYLGVSGLENEISVTIFQNHDLNRIRYTLKNLTGSNTFSSEPLSGLYLVYLKAVALNMSINSVCREET